jgi:hypothetical protein
MNDGRLVLSPGVFLQWAFSVTGAFAITGRFFIGPNRSDHLGSQHLPHAMRRPFEIPLQFGNHG